VKKLYGKDFLRKALRAQTDATQTHARRIVVSLVLFAFVISACGGESSAETSGAAAGFPTPRASVLPTNPGSGTAAADRVAPTLGAGIAFDGKHAYDEYLHSQMKFGIRPAGSKALRATGDYILNELQKSGWDTETQEFVYRGIPIRNVIGKTGTGKGPLIILGAHYDTRPRAEMDKENASAPVPGANDGASGVAVLLELGRTLDPAKLKNEVWLAFFDAEDNGDLSACDLRIVEMQMPSESCDSTPWTWSIGAIHLAEALPTKPAAVVVVDMIGDAKQDIYFERNSDKTLQEELWKLGEQLGYREWLIPEYRWSMTDDHTPFVERGIRAIDIIDFDYPPWHTTQDTADKVSGESLERVGRVLETWLEGGGVVE